MKSLKIFVNITNQPTLEETVGCNSLFNPILYAKYNWNYCPLLFMPHVSMTYFKAVSSKSDLNQ